MDDNPAGVNEPVILSTWTDGKRACLSLFVSELNMIR